MAAPGAILAGIAILLLASSPGASMAPEASATAAEATPAIVEITTVRVGGPGNAPVAIVPFREGTYPDCAAAPRDRNGCELVGGVDHEYEIGELEVTVGQYVDFLNTVDPDGTNDLGLYDGDMDPTTWPKYGPISRASGDDVASGTWYALADPAWADKPIGFTDFHDAARFVNALTNGTVLSRTTSTEDDFERTTYEVQLSGETEHGMYDLRPTEGTGATRTATTGFVIPSQDEWIKAAYFDPAGGGTLSYWWYPTGPFEAPDVAMLAPDTGAVANAQGQPLASYNPDGRDAAAGTYPVWCPPSAGTSACDTLNPLGLSASDYQADYHASLSSVGQALTRSPWGTLDQAGNVVEWTDTVTQPGVGQGDGRTWRHLHGGVSNAPAYQLWLSAVGLAPESDPLFEYAYPSQGFRVAVIGDLVTR